MIRGGGVFTLKSETRTLGRISRRELLYQVRERLDPDVFAIHTSGDATAPTPGRSTLLAVPLLRVRLTGRGLEISGSPDVVEALHLTLSSDGFGGASRGRLQHIPNSDVWRVLRLASDLFKHDAGPSEFDVGFAGYLGYDVAHYIEDLPVSIQRPAEQVDLDLAIHGVRIEVSEDGLASLTVNRLLEASGPEIGNVIQSLAPPETGTEDWRNLTDVVVSPVRLSVTRQAFESGVRQAQQYIQCGDIYQVQLGHSLEVSSSRDPVDVFEEMATTGGCPYTFFFRSGSSTVVGASPEAFVRVIDGVVEMVPIAGTRRCDGDDQPADVIQALRRDPKEQAEHVMLVDLARNDISRCTLPDSMTVPIYMQVHTYPRVAHLVSTVRALQRAHSDPWDVIRATFPAGTMTGAPKVRAMEIIEELESSPRGVYSGAVVTVGLGGFVDSALCIRAAYHGEDKIYRLRASAGVVADSDPSAEWQETLTKMRSTLDVVTAGQVSL